MSKKNPISQLSIHGFKSIRGLPDFELGRLNVLLGANGAGKSGFVSYFRMLGEMVEGRLQKWTKQQGTADRIVSFGIKETERIGSFIQFGLNGYKFVLDTTVDGGFVFSEERLYYSRAFKNMLEAGAVPVIDALILSEYINRCLRDAFNIRRNTEHKEYKNYKCYRCSPEGLRVARNVAVSVRGILKDARLHDTLIKDANIENILESIGTGALDFNDGVLIGNCRSQGWKLLTDDGDMAMGGIELLTANPKLLQHCTAD
ncbi:MAG: hypothetical protein LBP86_04785 [Azoarcus sp.]|jgi:hypothetical protein|nr:hypothetical protein [Azoarcus sp.]